MRGLWPGMEQQRRRFYGARSHGYKRHGKAYFISEVPWQGISMSCIAYRRMISTVLTRARGLKRRPLARHPIPGSSTKGDCTQQKNDRLSEPEFQAHAALE
jgi:hypothetical protein